MNEMMLQENLEKFIDIITRIKHSSNDNEGLLKINSYIGELKDSLNTLFVDCKFTCLDVFLTLNTDKEYFGVIVNPLMDSQDAFKIFATSEPVILSKYQIELDSRLFEIGLSPEEIASIIIFEISSIMNPAKIEQVRNLIDLNVLSENDVLHLRESLNYTQLIIYAIKDTLYKVSSIIFKDDPDDILANQWIQALNLQDTLMSAQTKLVSNVFGVVDSLRSPKAVILQWVFMVYQDIKGYADSAISTLRDAKAFTASKLLISEIDKTINAIDRAGGFIVKEDVALPKLIESKAMYSINELGLFKALKASGLRKIEDDYYELTVQAKTIESETDALFVLRSINSRLSILEDYIYNNTLKESEKRHWLGVAKLYRDLRTFVTEKKISKRKYNDIFMDYDDFASDND